MSWTDAQAYVVRPRWRIARPYRLLSDAEWEHAARAGLQARYFLSDDETKFCRYGDGADRSLTSIVPPQPAPSCNDGYAFTLPVGGLPAERLGPHGLGPTVWAPTTRSNALQRVADGVHRNYRGVPADGSAWTDESGDCTRRVGCVRPRACGAGQGDCWFDSGFWVARAIER